MTSLAGKRVLIVENEYFISSDLERALDGERAVVVGPTGDLDKGLALVAREAIDVAVLDVNLETAMSYPIADELAARAVPFLFLTGYDDWSLPDIYRDVPRITKPFADKTVLRTLTRLVSA